MKEECKTCGCREEGCKGESPPFASVSYPMCMMNIQTYSERPPRILTFPRLTDEEISSLKQMIKEWKEKRT